MMSVFWVIYKMVYKNDRFYVLDKMQNRSVYIFDRTGKFVSAISRTGDGPGEYVEIMDMDVDDENNVYVLDNGKTEIIKYVQANPDDYEIIKVGEHCMEFCFINKNTFLLKDVFGGTGQKMKLAKLDVKKNSIVPLIGSQLDDIDEMSIMRCSKQGIYKSNDRIYYNERFTPYIYTVSEDGDLVNCYTVASEYHAPAEVLKGLEKNPAKFIQESKYIKDITCIYENDEYWVCMPFITPSATYLMVPKNGEQKARKIDWVEKKELEGCSQLAGVADNKFLTILNYSDEQAEARKDNAALKSWTADSNPVLVLFTIR